MSETTSGIIEFGNQQLVWPVVGVILVAVLALLLSYRSAGQSFGFKLLLFSLKFCGIGLVALCLINPTLVRQRIRPGENIIVLLTDNSSSMQIQHNKESSRSERLLSRINADQGEWLTRLTQDFDLRRYAFDERLNQIENFEALSFSGKSSRLADSLDQLSQRFRSQPFAGVLLFTDGNASDLARLQDLEFGVPVYPVLEKPQDAKLFDLSIDQVSLSESPFEDAPVTISAVLSSTAQDPVETYVSLYHDDETATQAPKEKKVIVPAGESIPVSFQLTPIDLGTNPENAGVLFYRLEILPVENEEEEIPDEATLANNDRLISIVRKQTKNRILYVGGRPNWEYKFFNRALSEDRQVDLVSLIRIARKEAKFDFRGRVGEDANSLFRGQDREVDEETESFDQAVLIRLNTRDKEELSAGFPKTKAELFAYDGIILDDIEAGFFTQDQQKLLDRFVAERGGGLLMLGGRDSFHHGGWQKTSLRDVLPVYLDRDRDPPGGFLKWNLTREGWLEPWMRVRSTEVEERQRLKEIPPLEIVNSARKTKPGARVFAEIEDESGAILPAVVAQQYGQGRSIAVLVGDLWKWSMQRENTADDDLAQSWRQSLRWLVADVPQRVETELVWSEIGKTESAEIQVRLRDKEYLPKENATIEVNILSPDGKELKLTAEPSLKEAGLFEAVYLPRQAGKYVAEVNVTDETEPIPHIQKIGWTSDPDLNEFRQTEINRAALSDLAARTSGEVIDADKLAEFVKSLPQREMPMTEVQSTPLWHSPWVLVLALICFAGEWGLRRWRGMP